jgi:transcriptional regulator with XRE-family HTH domain
LLSNILDDISFFMDAGKQIDRDIGRRVRGLREAAGMSLEALAEQSGVSRAMLSRIELGESSPTAQLLNRVCAGLGTTLSALFASAERTASPLRQRSQQAAWRDPATGYLRRAVSPEATGSRVEIVAVDFPAGAEVAFAPNTAIADQHIWMLEGVMEMTIGDEHHRLETGDCLYMRLDQPVRFHNPSGREARYAVVLSRGAR